MKTYLAVVGLLFSLALTGCWTISETEFPKVKITPVPEGKSIAVRLSNYRTGIYNYIPVEGHESMTNSYDEASKDESRNQQVKTLDSSMGWGLQNSASGRLASRTISELERRGYTISQDHPEYIIEVRFENQPDDHVLRQVGYMIFTLCTAEKNEANWKAHLAVYDSKYEKVLFSKDYEQNYQVTLWGPIPVASPACSKKSMERAANSWALTALSDRALEDATAFIAGQKK